MTTTTSALPCLSREELASYLTAARPGITRQLALHHFDLATAMDDGRFEEHDKFYLAQYPDDRSEAYEVSSDAWDESWSNREHAASLIRFSLDDEDLAVVRAIRVHGEALDVCMTCDEQERDDDHEVYVATFTGATRDAIDQKAHAVAEAMSEASDEAFHEADAAGKSESECWDAGNATAFVKFVHLFMESA